MIMAYTLFIEIKKNNRHINLENRATIIAERGICAIKDKVNYINTIIK